MATEVGAGQSYANVAAAVVVKARPGRLVRIIVLVAGTAGTMTVYDNATAASGQLVYTSTGTADGLGAVITVDVPCKNGIYVTPATGQTLLVVYS